jgi:hypothetical protein
MRLVKKGIDSYSHPVDENGMVTIEWGRIEDGGKGIECKKR